MTALYKAAWDKLNTATPLTSDCGVLCGTRCCQGDAETGMLLFPGEEHLYDEIGGNWYRITDSSIRLQSGHVIKFLVCDGTCPRAERPLACRIFPLLPTLDAEDYLEFVPDLHAAFLCPLLASQQAPTIEPAFIDALYDAFELLIDNDDVLEFIEKLTEKNEAISHDLARFYEIDTKP